MFDLRRSFSLSLALALFGLALAAAPASAAAPQIRPLPPLRQQAEEQQAWLAKRLTEVVPALMREQKVDLWIVSMREYAEDPVFFSMVSPTTFAARRRTIWVFHDRGEKGMVRWALGGGSQGGLFETYRTPDPQDPRGELVGDEQWRLLRRLVEQSNPRTIALNIDPVHAFSDGLHAGEREALEAALGPELMQRVVRRPELALRYIETRIPEMLPRYRQIQETVHALIATAFSREVIRPGATTTEDVEWWLRQRVQELGMTVWFQPDVERSAADTPENTGWGKGVIQPGDALWVDFGVVAMGLHTDTQHLGYVLRAGEENPPQGLRDCLRTSNRLQDILVAELRSGRTGNEVLRSAREAMTAAGIDGTIYSHPVGDHGHGAGPLIGLWDRQEGVPVRGDLEVRPSTWFSIELQATSAIPEWNGRRLACRQEEDVYLDEKGDRRWVVGRQEAFHLVR